MLSHLVVSRMLFRLIVHGFVLSMVSGHRFPLAEFDTTGEDSTSYLPVLKPGVNRRALAPTTKKIDRDHARPPRGTAVPNNTPPLFRIRADTLYSAGAEHGRLAADRIRKWADEHAHQAQFIANTEIGKRVFAELKSENAAKFPKYADEIRGIAAGSGLALDTIWMLNLLGELELIESRLTGRRAGSVGTGDTPEGQGYWEAESSSTTGGEEADSGHCSDLFAVFSEGGFAHAHNEDWPGAAKELFYFVSYEATSSDFSSCAGLVYPGQVPGFAPTWNAHGVYATQNSLFPLWIGEQTGVASIFAMREALCRDHHPPTSDGRVVEDFPQALLQSGPWRTGASVNMVDLTTGRMVSIEVWMDKMRLQQVSDGTSLLPANYWHFNAYRMFRNIDHPASSSVARAKRIEELTPFTHTQSLAVALSDAVGDNGQPVGPLYRDSTMATLVLDVERESGKEQGNIAGLERESGNAGWRGILRVWSGKAAKNSEPDYVWDLSQFFGQNSVVGLEDDISFSAESGYIATDL